ncbi:MAG TPA: hypothetical protein VEG64_16895 [Candidatus Sulfotelmatobacter sp.]|nr:hypothetical protein [Candidatus Sulfotelmatobacter sp.]
MAFGLFWLRQKLNTFLGVGWAVRFTGKYDGYPCIEYVCPYCNKKEAWVAGAKGFQGTAPRAICCPAAVPYPRELEEFGKHLWAQPRWDNIRADRSPFIDNWDSVPDEFQYTKFVP